MVSAWGVSSTWITYWTSSLLFSDTTKFGVTENQSTGQTEYGGYRYVLVSNPKPRANNFRSLECSTQLNQGFIALRECISLYVSLYICCCLLFFVPYCLLIQVSGI